MNELRKVEEIYFGTHFFPWVGRPPGNFHEELIFYVPTFLGGHARRNRPKSPMQGRVYPRSWE